MNNVYDAIIVGTGVAGCFAALHLPEDWEILMITKGALEESDSFLAQGGICVLRDESDYDRFFEDTMRAGHYKNCRESVDIMIRSSKGVIAQLMDYGVQFAQKDGKLLFTREGAHSTNRILYHEDITGKEITSTLLRRVLERKNITIQTQTTMVDILCRDGQCNGILVRNQDGTLKPEYGRYVLWACGGIGGIYDHSTNFPHLTGDALAIALKHGIRLKNVSYVQIHPTTLYSRKPGRRFLISESVRGEGAVLFNKNMERFVNELLPRDLLTKEIYRQMEKDNMPYVWLCMKTVREDIKTRFPNICKRCLEEGYDVTRECIPVVPAQHYFMGGVEVDARSASSMRHLYAAGETSCNGVHGANRLASNSLLESLVFAERAARDMIEEKAQRPKDCGTEPGFLREQYRVHLEEYQDMQRCAQEAKESIWREIRKEREYESGNNKIKCG